jgi:uncharacterized membrane protein YqgA involved in biofilm formation
MPMLGVWVNVVAVLAGGVIGMMAGKSLPEKFKTSVLMAIGLGTLAIGVDLAAETRNLMIPISALVIGTAIGGLCDLERRFEAFAGKLKGAVNSDSATFVEGFVSASLLFCIGPMTIIGSINGGAFDDHNVLYLKSLLDGFAALALASGLGIGVLFSAGTILIVQGAICLAAMGMGDFIPQAVAGELSATGGLIILGIAVTLLEVKKLPLANFLPALVIVVPLALLVESFAR